MREESGKYELLEVVLDPHLGMGEDRKQSGWASDHRATLNEQLAAFWVAHSLKVGSGAEVLALH